MCAAFDSAAHPHLRDLESLLICSGLMSLLHLLHTISVLAHLPKYKPQSTHKIHHDLIVASVLLRHMHVGCGGSV